MCFGFGLSCQLICDNSVLTFDSYGFFKIFSFCLLFGGHFYLVLSYSPYFYLPQQLRHRFEEKKHRMLAFGDIVLKFEWRFVQCSDQSIYHKVFL